MLARLVACVAFLAAALGPIAAQAQIPMREAFPPFGRLPPICSGGSASQVDLAMEFRGPTAFAVLTIMEPQRGQSRFTIRRPLNGAGVGLALVDCGRTARHVITLACPTACVIETGFADRPRTPPQAFLRFVFNDADVALVTANTLRAMLTTVAAPPPRAIGPLLPPANEQGSTTEN